jgi:mono/diheme cytochrome c family protein
MKQIYGVVFIAGLIALGMVLIWPKLMTPPAPVDSGRTLSSASLIPVNPHTTYEWVDRSQGVARIPIERAIDILVEKGLPWGKVKEEPAPVLEAGTANEGKPAATPAPDPAMVQIGQALFTMYRCAGCHVEGSQFPPLEGKYGKRVNVEGGDPVLFDDAYIRESIYVPNAKIAAGYRAVMPAYKDRITEDEVKQMILYIRSLK